MSLDSDSEHIWHLACAFAVVLNPAGRSLDVYKELSRVEAIQSNKHLSDTDVIHGLRENDIRVQGPYGKILCTESGKWMFKRDSTFMRTPSVRGIFSKSFAFKRSSAATSSTMSQEDSHHANSSRPKSYSAMESVGSMRRSFSFRLLSAAAPPSDDPPADPLDSMGSVYVQDGKDEPNSISHTLFENTDDVIDPGGNGRQSSAPNLLVSSPSTSTPAPEAAPVSSSPPKRGLYSSLSVRNMTSGRSERPEERESVAVPPPPSPLPGRISKRVRSGIVAEALLEEITTAMVIYELFHILTATWRGVAEDTVAAEQRRLLERVNSRAGLLRANSKLDLIRMENLDHPASPVGSPPVLAEGGPTHDLNSELLNEMLLDIAQNALDMPSLYDEVEMEKQAQLEQQSILEKERDYERQLAALQAEEEKLVREKEEAVKRTEKKRARAARASSALRRQASAESDLSGQSVEAGGSGAVRNDQSPANGKCADDSTRSSRSPSRSSPVPLDDRSTGTGTGTRSDKSSRSGHSDKAKMPPCSVSGTTHPAPTPSNIPLRRPSWRSQIQPLFLTKKRRPSMAVRLALNEAGPFQKMLTEGVPVILHFAVAGSARPRRITRLMMLDDGSSEASAMADRKTQFWMTPGSTIYDDDDAPDSKAQFLPESKGNASHGYGAGRGGLGYRSQHPVHHQRLKFFQLESGEIKGCDGELLISEVCDIITGVHTTVFKQSLTQLHGEGMSYDKTGHEKRCFTMLMLSCKSPYDDRPVVDVEIRPLDKQRPEVRVGTTCHVCPYSCKSIVLCLLWCIFFVYVYVSPGESKKKYCCPFRIG